MSAFTIDEGKRMRELLEVGAVGGGGGAGSFCQVVLPL